MSYQVPLGYVSISSSALRPLGAAYVPILLNEVEQERRPGGNGDREATVRASVHAPLNTPHYFRSEYKRKIAVDLCLSIPGLSINFNHTCQSEFCRSFSIKTGNSRQDRDFRDRDQDFSSRPRHEIFSSRFETSRPNFETFYNILTKIGQFPPTRSDSWVFIYMLDESQFALER